MPGFRGATRPPYAMGSAAPCPAVRRRASFHHLRGEHGGTLRIRGRAPDRLTFELGLVPGRPALATYRSGDVLVGGDASSSSSSVV